MDRPKSSKNKPRKKIIKRIGAIFILLFFLFSLNFSFLRLIPTTQAEEATSPGSSSNLNLDTLEKTFNITFTFNQEGKDESFSPDSYPAELNLKNNLTAKVEYANKKSISLSSGHPSLKQTIILNNPTDTDQTLDIQVNHQIKDSTGTFTWDNQEYQATDTPQTFKPYSATEDIDLNDKYFDDQFENLPPEERNQLPKIKNRNTIKGTRITFPTKDNQTAVYDFSDLSKLNPEITIEKNQDNQIILTLKLNNIEVKANSQTILDPTYDIADSANYNLRFDGAMEYSELGYGGVFITDLNGNGKPDILVGAAEDSNNSRNASGSLYVIYDSLINDYTGTGNDIDLADSSNYNLRYDGAVEGDFLTSLDALNIGDVNGNGKPDILVGAINADNNSRGNSGSLYVIYDSLIDDYTGTSHNIDLADPDNYNLRYDGAATGDQLALTAVAVADISGNGKMDILVGAPRADNNSRSISGSLYVIYDSFIDDYSGTGHNIDLADPDNYNLRYDGAATGDELSWPLLQPADVNNNGKLDILVGADIADNNSRSGSGSLYVIYDSLIDDYSGTGHNIDLADPDNYNLRYDGAVVGSCLSEAGNVATDLDGNGKTDILLGDETGPSGTGSLYVIKDSLIDDYTGTGHNIDLAISTNYSLRYDGVGGCLTYGALAVADFNGNGKKDIIVGEPWATGTQGYLYVIYDSLIDDYSGLGQNIDLANPDNYSIRYDGDGESDFTYAEGASYRQFAVDINGDGQIDLAPWNMYSTFNDRNHAGALYILYNFPHTISFDSVPDINEPTDITVTGTVDASLNSLTNIQGVEYQIESDDPLGTWTPCTATDGAFDSKLEAFSCDVTSVDKEQTVYLRAYDTNLSYTAQSHYTEVSFYAQNAVITSWKAYQYQKPDTTCAERLKLTIKGKHFAEDAEVQIGGKEATSVDRKSSREIVAKFCLTKLLNVKNDLERSISVTNPDADKKTAKKKIDLGDLNLKLTGEELNPQTTEGIRNIQRKLVNLGLLDQKYITGFYGPITTEAVRKFQAQNNLPQTGTVGEETKAKLSA